jgi:hypothetical protein
VTGGATSQRERKRNAQCDAWCGVNSEERKKDADSMITNCVCHSIIFYIRLVEQVLKSQPRMFYRKALPIWQEMDKLRCRLLLDVEQTTAR